MCWRMRKRALQSLSCGSLCSTQGIGGGSGGNNAVRCRIAQLLFAQAVQVPFALLAANHIGTAIHNRAYARTAIMRLRTTRNVHAEIKQSAKTDASTRPDGAETPVSPGMALDEARGQISALKTAQGTRTKPSKLWRCQGQGRRGEFERLLHNWSATRKRMVTACGIGPRSSTAQLTDMLARIPNSAAMNAPRRGRADNVE